MRRQLLLSVVVAIAFVAVWATVAGTPSAAAAAGVKRSSPWSGVITIDYLQANNVYKGPIHTTLRLTKSGQVRRWGSETYNQSGTWEMSMDLVNGDLCQSTNLYGTYKGTAPTVLSWQYRGNERFYLAFGPSPQPAVQATFTKSENVCETGDPTRSGHEYFPIVVAEDSHEWYHRACANARTLTGTVSPGITTPSRTTRVHYQLTQLPDSNNDGIPNGGNASTGGCTVHIEVRRVVDGPQSNGSGTFIDATPPLTCTKTKCTGDFRSGTVVKLRPRSVGDTFFRGWSGGKCAGDAVLCAIKLDDDTYVDAVFGVNRQSIETAPSSWLARPDGGGASVYRLADRKAQCKPTNRCVLIFSRAYTQALGFIFSTGERLASQHAIAIAAKGHGCIGVEVVGASLTLPLVAILPEGDDNFANQYDDACTSPPT